MIGAFVSGCLAAGCTAAALRPLWPRRVRLPGSPATTRRPRVRRPATAGNEHQWADVLDALAADVRSGSSLGAAVERASADRHQTHRHDGDTAAALHTLGVAATLGGPVAATLQHGALVLRDRHAARAEAHAHSAQARLSATVLTVLPVAFTAVAFATSATFRAAALSSFGLVALATGAMLNLVGRRWMRRLVQASTR